MNLYPVQVSLLSALMSADYYRTKSPGLAKGFDQYALDLYGNPAFNDQVAFLVDRKLIDNKGCITLKGKQIINNDPRLLSNPQVGKEMNFRISVATDRGVLEDSFTYLQSKEIEHVVASSFNVLATRVEKGMIIADSIANAAQAILDAYTMQCDDIHLQEVTEFEPIESVIESPLEVVSDWKQEDIEMTNLGHGMEVPTKELQDFKEALKGKTRKTKVKESV